VAGRPLIVEVKKFFMDDRLRAVRRLRRRTSVVA
jgi:hypothetical protein